jgi:RNA polymerase sigma-54 factor
MTKLDLCLSPQLALGLRVTTDTVLAAELLSMSDAALSDRILTESARNPALIVERREPARLGPVPGGGGPEPAQRHDPRLRLVADAAPDLATEDRELALELAAAIDDRGFLNMTPEELSVSLGVPRDRVESVLGALRRAGPAGIATSGPRACVIAQLQALVPAPPWGELATRLLEVATQDLARGRLDVAARKLGAGRDEVERALAGIREHTHPYPDWEVPAGNAPAARPDVIVELVDGRPLARLPLDEGLTVRVDQRLRCDDPRLARAARDAEAFKRRLDQRRDSLLVVAQATIERQERAVRLGLSHLQPLTRREIARAVGLPESTVSRAVADRFLALPSGRVVAFGALFGAALDALSVLSDLIERATAPQSDQALARAMAAAGHPVARRTVAKYRARLGIAPLAARA